MCVTVFVRVSVCLSLCLSEGRGGGGGGGDGRRWLSCWLGFYVYLFVCRLPGCAWTRNRLPSTWSKGGSRGIECLGCCPVLQGSVFCQSSLLQVVDESGKNAFHVYRISFNAAQSAFPINYPESTCLSDFCILPLCKFGNDVIYC